MKTLILGLVLLLALATPAAAGKGGSLVPGGNTIAGPGAVSLAMGAQQTVFSDADASRDVCVTVANAGKAQVTLGLVGDSSPSIDVASGDTAALCVKNVQSAALTCSGTTSCSAQWRVDRN